MKKVQSTHRTPHTAMELAAEYRLASDDALAELFVEQAFDFG